MKSERKYITITDWIVFFVSTLLIFLSSILLLVGGLIIGLFDFFKKKPILAFSIILVLVILIIAIRWFVVPVTWSIKGNSVSVMIEEGDSMAKIVERLKQADLIEDGKWFLILSELLGKDRHIQAGRYDFSKGITLYSIFNKLVKGEVTPIEVLIPEGLTIREIAQILKKEISVDSARFVKIATDSQVAENLNIPASNLEGYLFPNTYRLNWGTDPAKLVSVMVNEFKKTFTPALSERAKEINFSVHDVVTLASMIETEAKAGEEREMISAVYHNRLKLGMLLQCDPTVIYAIGGERSRTTLNLNHSERFTSAPTLLLKDLEIDSPYNTYKYPGLPHGPICNPGKASILAALYPADVDYLYFVAKGDGTHIFSSTLDEHNRAKNGIKQAQKDKL
ncbi:MAG: endolytic transglycosylase MltG [Candidatus Atribacteria bacterium]|nr:endolytic transglycosylase MltG [Candidatus Atribacteria bacterium]